VASGARGYKPTGDFKSILSLFPLKVNPEERGWLQSMAVPKGWIFDPPGLLLFFRLPLAVPAARGAGVETNIRRLVNMKTLGALRYHFRHLSGR